MWRQMYKYCNRVHMHPFISYQCGPFARLSFMKVLLSKLFANNIANNFQDIYFWKKWLSANIQAFLKQNLCHCLNMNTWKTVKCKSLKYSLVFCSIIMMMLLLQTDIAFSSFLWLIISLWKLFCVLWWHYYYLLLIYYCVFY